VLIVKCRRVTDKHRKGLFKTKDGIEVERIGFEFNDLGTLREIIAVSSLFLRTALYQ
jgi:hypothetical protein